MSQKHSIVRADHVDYSMVLVFDDKGGARMTRSQGKMSPNERALALTVRLPTSIFKRPALRASIEVAAGEISIPPIDIAATQEALHDAFGADVLITIDQQENPQ